MSADVLGVCEVAERSETIWVNDSELHTHLLHDRAKGEAMEQS